MLLGYLWVALAYVAWKLVRLSDEKKTRAIIILNLLKKRHRCGRHR